MKESFDPFDEAPPISSPAGMRGEGRFEVSSCLRQGWDTTIQNFGTILAAMIVSWLMMLASYFTCIGIFLLIPIILWGQVKFILNTLDGNCEFNDIFLGFQDYGKLIGRMLLHMILLVLLGMVGSLVQYAGMFMESQSVAGVGVVLGLAWALIVMIRLYWSIFFVVDQDMDAVSALKASWNATQGNWLNLVLLVLVAFVVMLAGVLALLVGLFLAYPVIYFMYAASYRQTVGRPAPVVASADDWE